MARLHSLRSGLGKVLVSGWVLGLELSSDSVRIEGWAWLMLMGVFFDRGVSLGSANGGAGKGTEGKGVEGKGGLEG